MRQAATIETRYNREAGAIGKGKNTGLGAKRLATLEGEHSAKLAEITELERQLQPAKPLDDRSGRAAPDSGSRQTVYSGTVRHRADQRGSEDAHKGWSDHIAYRRCLNQSVAGRRTRTPSPISVLPAVPDGAIELPTAAEVMAAVKAGHRVGMAPLRRDRIGNRVGLMDWELFLPGASRGGGLEWNSPEGARNLLANDHPSRDFICHR